MECTHRCHTPACGQWPFVRVSWAIIWFRLRKYQLLTHENCSHRSVRIIFADWARSGWRIEWMNWRWQCVFTAAIGPGVFIVAASYSGCHRLLVVAMFTLGMSFMGTFYSGIKANSLDIAPNYAGVVMAIANGLGGLAGVIGPYIVGVLTPNVSHLQIEWRTFSLQKFNVCHLILQSLLTEWRIVFWITFVIFFVTTVIYVMFASGEIQDWNEPDKPRNKLNGTSDVKTEKFGVIEKI